MNAQQSSLVAGGWLVQALLVGTPMPGHPPFPTPLERQGPRGTQPCNPAAESSGHSKGQEGGQGLVPLNHRADFHSKHMARKS